MRGPIFQINLLCKANVSSALGFFKQPFYAVGSFCLFVGCMPSVKEIMTKNVITIDADKTVFEAAELMSAKSIGCLVICSNEAPVGIVTERDFLRRIVAKRASFDAKISEVMSKSLVTISPDASVKEAARLMATSKIRRLPVIKEGKLVGILVASDLVRHVARKSMSEEILDAIGRYPTGL